MTAYLEVHCDLCAHIYRETVNVVDDINNLREEGWVIDLQRGDNDRCPFCAGNEED